MTVVRQAHSSAVTVSCDSLHSSLSSLAEGGVSGAAREWAEEVGTLSTETSGDFAHSQTQLIEGVHTRVDKFVSLDIMQDVPTGNWSDLRI